MKTLSVILVAFLATAASAAIVEDFECGWAGAGTIVADPDNPSNSVLQLMGGDAAAFAMPGAGIVSMKIYDFGKTVQDDEGAGVGNNYGPRWGVAGDGTSVAASIISKTFINATKGYGYSLETSRTSSWWSPAWFGGPRNVDALQFIGSGTPEAPEVAGDGAWTEWTFVVSPSGSVSFDDCAFDGDKTMQMAGVQMSSLVEAWISGGRSGYALEGVLVDDISFTVPEPATMGLLALGGLVVARRRRSA